MTSVTSMVGMLVPFGEAVPPESGFRCIMIRPYLITKNLLFWDDPKPTVCHCEIEQHGLTPRPGREKPFVPLSRAVWIANTKRLTAGPVTRHGFTDWDVYGNVFK